MPFNSTDAQKVNVIDLKFSNYSKCVTHNDDQMDDDTIQSYCQNHSSTVDVLLIKICILYSGKHYKTSNTILMKMCV